jgi:hypothetical protein
MDRLFDSRIRVGRLEDRLFVAGPLTEHGIEPKADEQSDKRENNDDGQGSILLFCGVQHNAHNARIQRALRQACGIAPLLHGC